MAAHSPQLELFIYLVALMTMMNFVSHGTQDMYPTFLEEQRGFDARTVAIIAIIYNVGALLGGLLFGWFSDRWGRRRTMATAVICASLSSRYGFTPMVTVLTLGAFLMQFMVQGAWGVIPAHLAELSPREVRGLFSGLAYQIGVLMASGAAVSQALLAEKFGYAATLGRRRRNRDGPGGRGHPARPRAHGPRLALAVSEAKWAHAAREQEIGTGSRTQAVRRPEAMSCRARCSLCQNDRLFARFFVSS